MMPDEHQWCRQKSYSERGIITYIWYNPSSSQRESLGSPQKDNILQKHWTIGTKAKKKKKKKGWKWEGKMKTKWTIWQDYVQGPVGELSESQS
jgi:hypothetical protein